MWKVYTQTIMRTPIWSLGIGLAVSSSIWGGDQVPRDINVGSEDSSESYCVSGGYPLKLFCRAITMGDYEAIVYAVTASIHVDVNSKIEFGLTPLHISVLCERLDILKFLLTQGANPNLQSNTLETPLHLAVSRRNYETVQILLNTRVEDKHKLKAKEVIIDPNLKDDNGGTPLYYAVSSGDKDITQLLLNAGADPNLGNKRKETPLCLAVFKGGMDIVELLLKAGAKVDITDYSGTPLLINAVYRKNEHIVKLLLDAKADPRRKDNQGNTPLDIAEKLNIPEIAELLRKHLENLD